MHPYQKATERIVTMYKEALPYYLKIAGIANYVDDDTIYWNPNTGCYAVRELHKQTRDGFCKQGCAAFFDVNKNASPETGWVPIICGKDYRPFHELTKYAEIGSTPATLTLLGGLLGGAGFGGYRMWLNRSEPMTWKERFKDAIMPATIGAALGAGPGMLSAYNRYYGTKLHSTLGKGSTGSDVGLWAALTKTDKGLQEVSKNYKVNQRLKELDKTDMMKRSYFNDTARPIIGLDLDGSKVVHTDNFNRVLWDDVQLGSVTPQTGMLIGSTLGATSARTGNTFVTPAQIAGSLVNAGIGWGTSAVIGKTLGAMGVMNPQQQEKLRDLGTWGGMLNGIGNTIMH